MLTENKAEMFIRVLAEMLDTERKRQKTQLRLQHRTHAERFMKVFRSGLDGNRSSSEWPLRSRPMAQVAVTQSRNVPACTFSFITRNNNF